MAKIDIRNCAIFGAWRSSKSAVDYLLHPIELFSIRPPVAGQS
jgi:hypothetical protein